MKSSLKTKLERAQIENLVKINFPETEIVDIKELSEGNIGSIYVLRTVFKGNSATDIVLKVGMKADVDCLRYERDLFPTEIKAYHLLKDTNIPMPKLLKADMSCHVIPSGYFFMEFVEGKTWNQAAKDLKADEKSCLMKKLGEYTAQISSVKGDYFGYLKDGEQHHFKTHSESFHHMIKDILSDGKEHDVDLPYKELEGLIEKYRCLLDEVKEPRLVDFDLWAGNVFLDKKETVEISSIIDFGHCFYGDPYAAFTCAVHLFEDVEEETDFIKGYESVSKEKLNFTENDRIRMDLYRLYMALLCAVETYRYEKSFGDKLRASQLNKIHKLQKKLICLYESLFP